MKETIDEKIVWHRSLKLEKKFESVNPNWKWNVPSGLALVDYFKFLAPDKAICGWMQGRTLIWSLWTRLQKKVPLHFAEIEIDFAEEYKVKFLGERLAILVHLVFATRIHVIEIKGDLN